MSRSRSAPLLSLLVLLAGVLTACGGGGDAASGADAPAIAPDVSLDIPEGVTLTIIAEQINARSGIGFLMNEARTWFRTDIIVLGLTIYGLLGLFTDGIVRFLERTLLTWRRGFSGT